MTTYNFYTGEVMASPDNLSVGTNMPNIVPQNDPFCSYHGQNQYMNIPQYDPNQGFNAGFMYQQQPVPNFMNPPIMMNNGGGYTGNPAFEYIAQMNNGMGYNSFGSPFFPQQMNVAPPQDKVVNVPGYNTGSDIMLKANAEDICTDLQSQMIEEQFDDMEKRQQRFQGYFNQNPGSFNYYGMPFYGNYNDSYISAKYSAKIDDMRREAVERRKSFNKNLSRLCHNILNDGVSEEDINTIYDGYTYTIPGSKIQADQQQERLSRMVPVSNQAAYAKAYADANLLYDKVMGEHSTMNEFLDKLGLIQIAYNLEEETHRRRDVSQLYQGDTYRQLLKASKMAREKSSGGTPTINPYLPNNPMAGYTDERLTAIQNGAAAMRDAAERNILNMEGVTKSADGIINIGMPADMIARYSTGNDINSAKLSNELEVHYEENRQRFLQSIYGNNG